MTIERGQPWGLEVPCPDDVAAAPDDRTAARAVGAALRNDRPPPVMALLAGDLARTCGARRTEIPAAGTPVQQLPLDIASVLVDGAVHHFVAHLVARRSWWRGRLLAVMNAQYLGRWDVAPRSHPNDGKLDLFDADLSLGDRIKARSRLSSGTHVPHPGIAQRRVAAVQVDLDAGTKVWLDGECVGAARSLSIRVIPDAWTAVV